MQNYRLNFNNPSDPDLFALPHSIFYTLLLPPRPLVAKLSAPQPNGVECYSTKYHAIVYLLLLNAVSKLTSFPFAASHVPHLATPAPLTLG